MLRNLSRKLTGGAALPAESIASSVLSWAQLEACAAKHEVGDFTRGATNAHESRERIFDSSAEPRVLLYRDHHAWCPYCQKVWLWLEESRVNYRIRKVTMFCYGEKERWFTDVVPSGMLPAIELDGHVVTESDDILMALEHTFGALGRSMSDPDVLQLRRLERQLFGAWCDWLCRPGDDRRRRKQFEMVAGAVERALAAGQTAAGGDGAFFFGRLFSVADVVFAPYLERMNASLYYYKGFELRDATARPRLSAWFDAMESRPTYRGTQSDFHTHAHDLPPQMGGCFENGDSRQQQCRERVDAGLWSLHGNGDSNGYKAGEENAMPEASYGEGARGAAALEAIARVLRHREAVLARNPNVGGTADESLRHALTELLMSSGDPQALLPADLGVDEAKMHTTSTGVDLSLPPPPPGADINLRYIRDRVNVPRDMSLWAARHLRAACERVAAQCGARQADPIPTRHRRDQNPRGFAGGVKGAL